MCNFRRTRQPRRQIFEQPCRCQSGPGQPGSSGAVRHRRGLAGRQPQVASNKLADLHADDLTCDAETVGHVLWVGRVLHSLSKGKDLEQVREANKACRSRRRPPRSSACRRHVQLLPPLPAVSRLSQCRPPAPANSDSAARCSSSALWRVFSKDDRSASNWFSARPLPDRDQSGVAGSYDIEMSSSQPASIRCHTGGCIRGLPNATANELDEAGPHPMGKALGNFCLIQ